MIKIGSVWQYEKEDGTMYFSGKVEVPCPLVLEKNTRILLFQNKSEHEKSPALDMLIAENKPKPQAKVQSRDSDVPF